MFTIRQIFIATTLISLTLLVRINGYVVVIDWWVVIRHNAELYDQLHDYWIVTGLLTVGYLCGIFFCTVVIDLLIEEASK